MLCLTVAYALGVAVEQYHVRSRMAVPLALIFLFLSFSTIVGYWCVSSFVRSVSPIPYVLMATLLVLPIDLLGGWRLLKMHEAQQSTSEPRKKDSAGNPDDETWSA